MVTTIRLACVLVICIAAVPGCRRGEPAPLPAPPAAEVRVEPPPAASLPAEAAATQTQPSQAEQLAAGEPIEVRTLGPEPAQPLAILSKLEEDRPAVIRAVLRPDNRLIVNTENVGALRLDLPALPRERPGRLILHIDRQGIEITGRAGSIIYLKRSSIGEWSFARPDEVPRLSSQ